MGQKRKPVLAAVPDRWYGVAIKDERGKLQRYRGCCVRANGDLAVIRFPLADWPFPREIELPLSMLIHASRPRFERGEEAGDTRAERARLVERLHRRRARARRHPLQLLP